MQATAVKCTRRPTAPAAKTTTSAASAVDEAARGTAEIITSSAFTHGITALTIDNPKYARAVGQKSADMKASTSPRGCRGPHTAAR